MCPIKVLLLLSIVPLFFYCLSFWRVLKARLVNWACALFGQRSNQERHRPHRTRTSSSSKKTLCPEEAYAQKLSRRRGGAVDRLRKHRDQQRNFADRRVGGR
uniref:Secreted protein n=1 Tax=Steinernema glaseri TaxID=37863 RepID=A0A1I7YJV5_9BILA